MFELTNTYKKKLTYSDYAAKDDGKRYELINGVLKMSPAPSMFHNRSNIKLVNLLYFYVENNYLGWVFDSPADVILDKFNTVQPDILFISKDNKYKIKRNGVCGAPDLVVEIISPSSIDYDRTIKKDIYEKFGVKEYWLIDIDNKTIEVYENIDGIFTLYSCADENGHIISKILPGFDAELIDFLPDL